MMPYTLQSTRLHEILAGHGLGRFNSTSPSHPRYDAVHLREQRLQRLPDPQIVEKAREEDRIILTHDLDFGRIVALSQMRLPSVVTFRLTNMRHENVNAQLDDIISRFIQPLLSGALISVTDTAIRVRRLPID